MRFIFIVANTAIALGYMFVAVFVAPNFGIRLTRTKIGGVLFFVTCGLTHLELALHTLMREPLTIAELTSWHMLTIHVVQAFSIWFFVTGLWQEFILPKRDVPNEG